MLGDSGDIRNRLKSLLPAGWFSYVAPIRDAVLGGIADTLSWIYGFILTARLQTRINTATGYFLDLIGLDYFGTRFRRRKNENDASWRSRIGPEIRRERATRHGIEQALTDLTGIKPVIIEFFNGFDCGSYGGPYIGYGLAGVYGTVLARTQFFVNAFRPGQSGIPEVPGYGIITTAVGHVLSGYGITGEYCDLSQIIGTVTDADIFAAVAATEAAGTIGWTNIQNGPSPGGLPHFYLGVNFILGTSTLG